VADRGRFHRVSSVTRQTDESKKCSNHWHQRDSAVSPHSRKAENWPVSIQELFSNVTARCPLIASRVPPPSLGRDGPAADASPRARGRQKASASVWPAACSAATGIGMTMLRAAEHEAGVTSLTPTGCRCPAAGRKQLTFQIAHTLYSFRPLWRTSGKCHPSAG